MQLQILKERFAILKLAEPVPARGSYWFESRTDEELSLVCPETDAPEESLERADGWRAFRIAGVLDFSLIGILARITTLLAGAHIGVFVVSTYNTDYVFVREQALEDALGVLKANGYEIVRK